MLHILFDGTAHSPEDQDLRRLFEATLMSCGHSISLLDALTEDADTLILWNALEPTPEALKRIRPGSPILAIMNHLGLSAPGPRRRPWFSWMRAKQEISVFCTSPALAQRIGRQAEVLPPMIPPVSGADPLPLIPGMPLRVAYLSSDPTARAMLDEAILLSAEGRCFAGIELLPNTLDGAHVAVQPRHPSGAYPLMGAEALSRGIPLILEAGGPLDPVIQHGVSALVYQSGKPRQLANRWSQLLNEPDRASRIGTAGQEAVRGQAGIDDWISRIMKHLG